MPFRVLLILVLSQFLYPGENIGYKTGTDIAYRLISESLLSENLKEGRYEIRLYAHRDIGIIKVLGEGKFACWYSVNSFGEIRRLDTLLVKEVGRLLLCSKKEEFVFCCSIGFTRIE